MGKGISSCFFLMHEPFALGISLLEIYLMDKGLPKINACIWLHSV